MVPLHLTSPKDSHQSELRNDSLSNFKRSVLQQYFCYLKLDCVQMQYLTLNPVWVGNRSLTDSLKDIFPNSNIGI